MIIRVAMTIVLVIVILILIVIFILILMIIFILILILMVILIVIIIRATVVRIGIQNLRAIVIWIVKITGGSTSHVVIMFLRAWFVKPYFFYIISYWSFRSELLDSLSYCSDDYHRICNSL